MAFTNLDNARGDLIDFVNNLETVLGATPTAGAAVADVTVGSTLTGVDTGTDMTTAQAAQIVTDLGNLATAVNAVIARLEAHGLIST